LRGLRVAQASIKIDDATPAMKDGEGGADLAAIIGAVEVALEAFADALEAGNDFAIDVNARGLRRSACADVW
jgi:hypothetical protein